MLRIYITLNHSSALRAAFSFQPKALITCRFVCVHAHAHAHNYTCTHTLHTHTHHTPSIHTFACTHNTHTRLLMPTSMHTCTRAPLPHSRSPSDDNFSKLSPARPFPSLTSPIPNHPLAAATLLQLHTLTHSMHVRTHEPSSCAGSVWVTTCVCVTRCRVLPPVYSAHCSLPLTSLGEVGQ